MSFVVEVEGTGCSGHYLQGAVHHCLNNAEAYKQLDWMLNQITL